MLHATLRRILLLSLIAFSAPAANAETVTRIRVMLHPSIAAAGQLPDNALALLRSLSGTALSLAGTTRTGSLELTLPEPLDVADASALAKRLRDDRSVVWAEPVTTPPLLSNDKRSKAAAAVMGQKLMLKLARDVAPEWPTLLARWGSLIGAPLAIDHQIGDIWVVKLAQAVPDAQLANMASQLETDPSVQYADPVRRASIKAVPNDADFALQWSLSDPVGGINAPAAWDLQKGSAGLTVAVVDTGITSHPDLAGRVLPGYDFITDAGRANDGNGRDNDASDTGDFHNDGDCGGAPAEPSSWHGTFVSGVIAANTNNGIGIAGIDWNAKILPVRVLGKCGGTFDDIVAGVMWAAGLPVVGAPPNPNPARVINLSLGGFSACSQAFQDVVNQVLALGTVVAVAAGNETADASTSTPANCSGVITVGASARGGDRTSYSNFGGRVDISAPGGDFGDQSTEIFSTSNDGVASPGSPTYSHEVGTSFAAPQVAGVASLMFARNANLTPGRVLNIMSNTARLFPSGTTCSVGGACGVGLLDAGLALQSTPAGDAVAPAGTVPVIEYYRGDKDHYFMSANAAEIAFTDLALSATFKRTGELFYAWPTRNVAPASATPVCRLYNRSPLVDSHFYSANPSECQFVQTHYAGAWVLENAAAFYVLPSDASGACPAQTAPVYRFFDNRNDANHRHTVDLSVRRAMINRQWAAEGTGPNGVAFCAPI